ncbi:MAG: hypothetical protein KDE20_06340 [Caldilineaceae bacterium]|nr:hypothetical protein [Caldilineaceae bacterium]
MKFGNLLEAVGDEVVFETGLLLDDETSPADVHRQLTRWKNAGRIMQLRRGLYFIAAPYQRRRPHPFLVANRLLQPSYVSMQSALAFAGMIPEYVPVTTSLTTRRTSKWNTPVGTFIFHHTKPERFYGFRLHELGNSQSALVALPEKALLDLIHLQPQGDNPDYLDELRLQNLDQLDLNLLGQFAAREASPKLQRAVAHIAQLAGREAADYEML